MKHFSSYCSQRRRQGLKSGTAQLPKKMSPVGKRKEAANHKRCSDVSI